MPADRSATASWKAPSAGSTAGAARSTRPYRVRSLAAKLVLAPVVLVMLVCFYGSMVWTVYISMTRPFLLPVYHFAGVA